MHQLSAFANIDLYTLTAQGIGIVAMLFNIFSYQQKTQKGAIAFLLCGTTLFSVNFFMLGATVGCFMNIIGAIRSIVYLNKKRLRADSIYWLIFFVVLYVAAYIVTLVFFKEDPKAIDYIIELLPVIGMTAATIGFMKTDAAAVRRYGLICSPSWLIYNICNFAVGAIICEVLSLCSIIIGIIRFDIKKKNEMSD